MGMPRSQVNKDPEVARKRARTDARCAFKKLDLLSRLEEWGDDPGEWTALVLLTNIAEALGVKVQP
jgi:hypothetical protein